MSKTRDSSHEEKRNQDKQKKTKDNGSWRSRSRNEVYEGINFVSLIKPKDKLSPDEIIGFLKEF